MYEKHCSRKFMFKNDVFVADISKIGLLSVYMTTGTQSQDNAAAPPHHSRDVASTLCRQAHGSHV